MNAVMCVYMDVHALPIRTHERPCQKVYISGGMRTRTLRLYEGLRERQWSVYRKLLVWKFVNVAYANDVGNVDLNDERTRTMDLCVCTKNAFTRTVEE